MAENASLDLATIMETARVSQQVSQNIVNETAAVFDEARGAVRRGATAAQEEGRAASEALLLEEQAKISKAAKNKRAAAIFGTDIDASNSVLQAMATSIFETSADLKQRDVALQEKLDTRFLDDPLAWIVNQFTLPQEVSAYNSQVQNLNMQNSELKQLIDHTKEVITVNNAIDAGTSEAIATAKSKQLLAVAEQRAAEHEQRLASLGMNQANIRLAVNQEQFRNVLALDNALTQRQQLALSRSANQLATQRLALDKELKDLQVAEKEDKAEARAAFQKKLNRVSDVFGLAPITVREFELMTGPRRDMYQSAMSDPNVQMGQAAKDAATSLAVVNNINAPLNPGLNIVRKSLVKVQETVIKQNEATWKALEQDVRHNKVQEAIEARVRAEATNIPETGGIYSAPSLSAVGKIPAVAATALWKLVEPLTVSTEYPAKADDFFQAATNAIVEGKIDPRTASTELATIFRSIVADNNTQRQYQKLAVPRQATYNTSVRMGTGWTGSTVVDLSNQAAVDNAILRRVAVLRAERTMGLGGNVGFGGAP